MSLSNLKCIASTVGFEQPAWVAGYYPEECPQEWRLAYFMNDFRAVYLPSAAWYDKPQAIAAIAEELEGDFELVLEWPPLESMKSVTSKLKQLSPLKEYVRAVVIANPGDNIDSRKEQIEIIGEQYVVAMDDHSLGVADNTITAQYTTHWQLMEQTEAANKSALMIIILPCLSIREIRSVVDKFKPCIERGTTVRLFFEPMPQSPERAIETRTLIELMGLA